jgi:hypothetical protein
MCSHVNALLNVRLTDPDLRPLPNGIGQLITYLSSGPTAQVRRQLSIVFFNLHKTACCVDILDLSTTPFIFNRVCAGHAVRSAHSNF